jgi:hypothetical protein
MGRWILAGNAEILDAAGAKKVYKVYINGIAHIVSLEGR